MTTLLCFGLVFSTTNAFFSTKQPAEVSFEVEAAPSVDTSLSALIMMQLNGQEAFDRVLHTIQTYTTESSCNKAAYASLTLSCNTLEGSASETTIGMLDLAKTTFAARLAVCELVEAGRDAVPAACAFMLDDLNSASTQNNYDGSRIKACTRGMHGDHRAWNSFSNAKQNAIRICHATRSHVERDATLKQVQHILKQHHQESDSSIDFAVAMGKMRSNVLDALARLTEGTELVGKLNAAYVAEYEGYLKESREQNLALSEELQDAARAAFQLVITNSEAAHMKMLDRVGVKTDLAVEKVSVVTDGLQAVHHGIVTADNSLTVLGARIVALEDRVTPLGESMVELTAAVKDLHDATQAHTIAQEEAGGRVVTMLVQIEEIVENISGYSTMAAGCFEWLTSGRQWLKLFGFAAVVLCVLACLPFLLLLLCWRLGWLQQLIIRPVRDIWQGLCDG
ncbi:hypothetical protein AMS68_006929 [Peltaster fructicola]|uniref:Nuclear fusion protein KAR5 n=1 Tax=Peltaster fructicola TaxID=286661 RepID=A0A6H0Y323_9PEZI|nr:hypothetical protein AMS68_006929 [Peltaster fructicola]